MSTRIFHSSVRAPSGSNAVAQVFHHGAAPRASGAQAAAAVSAALGKKPFAKIRLPLSMVGVVATISEKIGAWRNQATAINREKMNELGAASWRCDISPLTDDVHWLPKFNLAEGMKEAVVWYRKHGWL